MVRAAFVIGAGAVVTKSFLRVALSSETRPARSAIGLLNRIKIKMRAQAKIARNPTP